jgi:hypothetical protein
VRLEESEAFLSDPRLGDPLRSAAVAGSLDLRECGTRARAEASGDGGPESGGWRGWIERVAGDVSGEVAFEARAFDRVARRVLPAGDFPAAPAGPVTFALSRKAGERALRVSGTAPVPEAVLGAGGRAVRVGPERAAFDAWVGPLAGGRLELAGRVDLGSAVYAGPAGESRFRALSVRLDHGTTIDFDRREARLAALVDGAFAGPVRVWDDPALEVERPVVRADLAVSRDRDRRFRLEGGVSVAGLVEVGEDGRARWPVAFEGAFDPGTWIQPRTRTAQLQGRFLVDGLRVERRGMPLVALGPPGCEAALAIRPGSAAGLWVAEGDVRVRGLTVDSPKVAREPVAVVLDVAGVFAVDVPARQGTLEQGRVRVGEVEMAASGAFAGRSGTPAFRVALAGSHVRCQDLLEALPPPLRADLPGLEFGGSVDFHLAFDVDLADPRSTVFDLNATSRCRVTAAAEPIQMQRLRGTFRHEIVLPGGRTETIETGPGSPDWVPLSEISPYMVAAVVTTEDARFFRHSGVSIRDLREAIVRDLREGRFAYGGSTIDMQVVKNVFLDREKTVARKVQELILTWWLDQALDKNQIMELYLNVIEYGPGIYGIGPAARHFFGRIPADLSPLEAVYLAKLLPDPVRRYRMYSGNLVPTNWRNRLDHILGIMYQRGDLAEEEYQAAVHDRLDFYYPGEPLPPPRYGVLGPLAPAEEPAGEPLPPEDPGWRLLEEPPPDDGGYPPAPEVW